MQPIPIPAPIHEPKPEPIKPKKEPVPIQIVTEPVVMQPIPTPEPVPVPKPEPIPVPIVKPEPTKPVEMLPQKPLFETQTEIKAKFVIEMEEEHPHKPHYECEIQCPEIDYKNYYYDEDSESDSDSDCDDRDKKKHLGHKEDDEMELGYENHPYYSSPMYRRLEKVLGKLREYEPFDEDDSKEKWFKVEDDVYLLNSATIPLMGAIMPVGYPFMCNECTMIGRKDYILGVKYARGRKDKKYIKIIMFGIPGMYNKQEERYYRLRGYTHFKPHKSKNHGYWIMPVDVVTGEIIMK